MRKAVPAHGGAAGVVGLEALAADLLAAVVALVQRPGLVQPAGRGGGCRSGQQPCQHLQPAHAYSFKAANRSNSWTAL